MGRMGVGPDLGDEQIGGGFSEWQCSRCNYPNTGSTCRDCGQPRYMLVRRYEPEYEPEYEPARRTRAKCTCGECPVHGKKEKPPTKKQKEAQKKREAAFLKQIQKQLYPKKAAIKRKKK